jgi:hypothetical protein
MDTTSTTIHANARRAAELERELESLRLRLIVTKVVARDASQWLNDDDASLEAIITDVVRQWQARLEDEPTVIDGPDGFWSRYANRIEWAAPDSDDEYRREFCPLHEAGRFDTDAYFHAVWAAHVAELRSRSVAVPTGA